MCGFKAQQSCEMEVCVKKRTFYTTLLLFLVFLNGMLCAIISLMLKDRLESARESAQSEQYMIASMIGKDMQAFQDKGGAFRENLQLGMRQYTDFLRNNRNVFILYEGEEVIFQNKAVDTELLEALSQKNGQLENGCRAAGFLNKEESLYYVAGTLSPPFTQYRLLLCSTFSEIIGEWKEYRFFLFAGGALVSALFAVCLLLLIQKIFSPLSEIAAVSGEIANGQYKKRLPVMGHNEVADMAVSFNNMADKIQKQILALDMAARQKQEFVDNFAHELKTPLTAIYGYAQYLQNAAVSREDELEALDFILSECRRIQKMEKQLLNLALLRENAFEKEILEVPEFFRKLQAILLPKTTPKNISLLWEPQIRYLSGNKGLLEHLLINLIINAIQSCSQGGHILIRAYEEKGKNHILIKDNGCGMEQTELIHITEAFYRIDKSRSREEGGAGLGLAICSRIAHMEHIGLEFTSSPGKGTTVYLSFTTP